MEPMQLRLQPTPESASEARKSVLAWSQFLDPVSLSDVRTVVSELVALSVKHGSAGPIDLQLELGQADVKGIVFDNVAHAMDAAAEEPTFALLIIDGLVDEWSTDPERRAVRFRMPIERLNAA
jgi:anti-sigma regulatory factor (Ser/Thr protein kinase)